MRHLKIYRAIRLIHRQGSIRKAAEVLSVSPSALNRSVQAFEEEFGTEVFERVAGGVRLSSAGELALAVIDRHLADFDGLLDQISDLRDGLAGHLAISVGTDLDAGLVLEVIAGFERAHPGVSVEIISGEGVAPLRQRQVDLAILSQPQTDDSVEVLHSAKMRLGAWQRGAPGASLPKIGLWDLVEERLLLPPEGTGSRTAISHLLRRSELREGVHTSASAAQAGQRMASGSDGLVALFPDMVMRDQGTSLHRLPLDLGAVQCSVLRAARVPMTRPAQAVFALLQARLDGAANA